MVLVVGFGLLALFSIVTVLMSDEDPQARTDPRDNPMLWMALGRR